MSPTQAVGNPWLPHFLSLPVIVLIPSPPMTSEQQHSGSHRVPICHVQHNLYRILSSKCGSAQQTNVATPPVSMAINLREVDWCWASESRGKVVTVKIFALCRSYRTKGVSRHGAKAAISAALGTSERTMLLLASLLL